MRQASLFSLDIPLILALLCLIIIGILFIYSANTDSDGKIIKDEFLRQIIFAVIGIILLFFFSFFSYLKLRDLSLLIYLISLGLLILTLVINFFFNRSGIKPGSWLGIGGLGIQVSEFAKLSTIIFLSSYLVRIGSRIAELPYFILSLLIILAPVFLILLQPDMGTALVFFPIFIAISWMAGTKKRYLAFLFFCGAVIIFISMIPQFPKYFPVFQAPFFKVFILNEYLFIFILIMLVISLLAFLGYFFFKESYYYWIMYAASIITSGSLLGLVGRKVFQPYQIKRLIIFLNPYVDTEKYGYNIIQSVTAVGSGGFWGKGFMAGTQSQLKYVPEQSNDFIFSIIAEEWGFLGGSLIFGLFIFILLRCSRIIKNSGDLYARLLGTGIIAMLLYHCIINIGMTMGLMPITGIPLFFVSYGGSALLTGLISVGIIQNIYYRRYM